MDQLIPPFPPPRVGPLTLADRTAQQQALVDAFAVGANVNVYATMARRPDILARCIPLGQALRGGSLSTRERELLILRIAWRCHSPYILTQHVRAARAAGVTDDELARVVEGPDAAWEPGVADLLRAADELFAESTISDATWERLASRHDDGDLIEIVMTAGYYHMLAFFLNALGVPPNAPA